MTTQSFKRWLFSLIMHSLPWLLIMALAAIVYYGFFDDSEKEETFAASRAAIENYLANPNKENAQLALDKFEFCDREHGVWACGGDKKEKFIWLLIEKAHIDITFQNESNESGFYRPFATYLEESASMTVYTGQLPEALILKANAFARQAKVSKALQIYKELFERGERWEVATSLRSLFTYYGCIDDVKIWGEFTAGHIKDDAQPGGSAYPEQSQILSNEEIIDRRIQLQKGEFVEPSEKCPVNRLLENKTDIK